MTLETMIGALSRDERLAAMDLIWRELTTDSQPFASPKWHEKVIGGPDRKSSFGSSVAAVTGESVNKLCPLSLHELDT